MPAGGAPTTLAESAQLLETMRLEQGRVPLLRRHLGRLEASAQALGFVRERLHATVCEAVRARATALEAGVYRLRLLYARDGAVRLTSEPLVAAPLRVVAVWPEPFAEAGTARCRHKTTDRTHYEIPYAWARSAGADEALLADANGFLIEGTRTSVWLRLGDRLCTPPLEAGGLPGVARAHLLATRADAEERPLHLDDLARADAVFASNALHGLRRVGEVRSAA
ncbi:MAG: aminotransferase class IV [Rubricoccaceae bacterium]